MNECYSIDVNVLFYCRAQMLGYDKMVLSESENVMLMFVTFHN